MSNEHSTSDKLTIYRYNKHNDISLTCRAGACLLSLWHRCHIPKRRYSFIPAQIISRLTHRSPVLGVVVLRLS